MIKMMSSKRRHILHQQSHILCYSLPPFNRLRARQIPMVTIRSPEQNSSRTSLSKSFQVQRVSSHEELHMAHAVRRSVFTKEMGIPENVVFDEMDEWGVCPEIFHFIAYRDDKAIGTARISRTRNGCQLERMAIDADFRGLGAGKALLDKVEQDEAIWSSMGPLFCHAKAQKESFYTRFGWVVEEGHSDIDHTGTPHVVMVRRRRPRGAAAVNGHALSHVMVKTKDISKAMKFYSLLGYETKVKFLSQGLKCAWIEVSYITIQLKRQLLRLNECLIVGLLGNALTNCFYYICQNIVTLYRAENRAN